MDLQTIVDISQVVAAITVIGGTAFAVLQLREFRRQRQAGPDVEKAATLMCTTFEAIGILVHRQIAPFPLVQDLIGGITVVVWPRLGPWITQLRAEQANPPDSEWFQWLAEEFERRKAEKVPACEQHRD